MGLKYKIYKNRRGFLSNSHLKGARLLKMQDLIEKFLNRTISKNERKQLKKWVLSHKDNLKSFKKEIKKQV